MDTSRADIRQQVKAQIIETIAQAQAAGLDDGIQVARKTYPGTPDTVLYECWAELDQQQEEAWWKSIERTIDAEIIRAAISGPAGKVVPAGSRDAHLDEAFAALMANGGGAA